MESMKLKDRVVAKANRQFVGEVIEAAADGQSGYVRFDGEDEGRVFFHISELDPERPEPKAEAAPAREIAPPPPPIIEKAKTKRA